MIDYLNSGVELSREVAGRIVPVEGICSDLAGHWGADAANQLIADKIVFCPANGLFNPDKTADLNEFAGVLTAAFELSDEDAAALFPAEGTAEPVTRADAALYLKRLADCLGIELTQGEAAAFTDIGDVSAEAAEAIIALQRGGIINGVGGGLYLPDGNITRAQLATLVSKLLPLVPVAEQAAA